MNQRALTIAAMVLIVTACREGGPTAPDDMAFAPSAVAPEIFDGVGRVVWVTNNRDAGPGSLRAAVEEANRDAAVRGIRFATHIGGQIEPRSQIVFDGPQPLTVEGQVHIVTLDAPGVGLLFKVRSALTLRGFGVEDSRKVGLGILVQQDAIGEVHVNLENMYFLGVYSHAVWITDQDVPESTPVAFSDAGSPASLHVTLRKIRVTNTAFEAGDAGVRVSEGGDGDLHVTIDSSIVQYSGGGIDLDERGAGVLAVAASHSTVAGIAFRPGNPLVGAFTLRESGTGGIDCRLHDMDIIDNYGDGLDLVEFGSGNVTVVLSDVRVDANGGSAITIAEDADDTGSGSLSLDFVDLVARSNAFGSSAAAVNIAESADGNIEMRVVGGMASANAATGVSVSERGDGHLTATLAGAAARGNGGDGIDLAENDGGDLSAGMRGVNISENAGFGVRLRQSGAGLGRARISASTLLGNALGAVDAYPNQVLVTRVP